MRAINVLELRDTHEVGGPGKTILETAKAIDASRFRVQVGVFRTDRETGDTPFMAAAVGQGLPVHEIRGMNQYDPRLVTRTAALARRLSVDIVHAHEVKSDVIAYLASQIHRVPVVTTLHGWIGNSPKQRAMIALDKLAIRGFDLVIAVSRTIARQAVAAGVSEDRVRVLSNGIVMGNYRRSPGNGYLERLIGRQPRGPVAACIGRLSVEKGHADLLAALAFLARQNQQIECVIVGDGPERRSLEERARGLGLGDWVTFTGYLDRPQEVLNAADILVLPSHTEGLPNVALEALAMDVPVLATKVGGTPEVIIEGETGRLVEPRDPAALAVALEDFLLHQQLWRAMAVRGRRHVEEHFDFQLRTSRLELMYLELAGERR